MPLLDYIGDVITALKVSAAGYRTFSLMDYFRPETDFLPELAEIRDAQADRLAERIPDAIGYATWTPGEAHRQLGLGVTEAWGPGSVRWRVRAAERRLGVMASRSTDFDLYEREQRVLVEVQETTAQTREWLRWGLIPRRRFAEGRLARGAASQPSERGREFRVWYATNRRSSQSNPVMELYTEERGDELHLGACDVFIPDRRATGSTGSWWWQRLRSGDDRLRIVRSIELVPDTFWRALQAQLALSPMEERSGVVFIHGYNTSFKEAAIRTAQLGVDLKVSGAMALFSWPSIGSMRWYPGDVAAIEASELALTQFLIEFVEKSGAHAIHIIAHSMGNRGLLRAVNNIAVRAQERTGVLFSQIVLAAPDVDCEVFAQLASAYQLVCDRATLYAASGDLPVRISGRLHRYPRAGILPPVTIVSGIDTVDASKAGLTGLGHNYFCAAKQVLGDIYQLISSGAAPSGRFGVTPARAPNGGGYWKLK